MLLITLWNLFYSGDEWIKNIFSWLLFSGRVLCLCFIGDMRHVIKNSIWQEQTEKGNFLYKQSLRYCRSIYSYLFKHTLHLFRSRRKWFIIKRQNYMIIRSLFYFIILLIAKICYFCLLAATLASQSLWFLVTLLGGIQ